MNCIDFNTLKTRNSIAINFGIHSSYLEKILHSPDYSALYETLHIPKRSKKKTGYRTVYKADDVLANLHKNILTSIKCFLEKNEIDQFIHDSAHGFVNNKTTLSNAVPHLNKQSLLQVDIESFFKSIPIERIIRIF